MARRPRRLRKLANAVLPRSPLKRLLVVAGALLLAAIVTLNLAVSFFGNSLVNPLSPFSLKSKAIALGRYFRHRPHCLFSGHDDLPDQITRSAKRYRLDRALLQALVDVESGARAHRISGAGAMGPAQLVPSTADMLGVKDPFDPSQAIDGGARYLKEQLIRFDGNVSLAVAAYNAGPGAVLQGRVPHNGETEYYVDRVLARWRELRPAPVRKPNALAR